MHSGSQDLHDAMHRVVFHTVRPLSLGFGLFIGYTATREILDGELASIVAADVFVTAYLLALAAWLWLRPPPLRWMNALGASVALALAGTDITTQSVRGAIPSFPATALVLAGIGAVVLSWRWLLGTQAAILAVWITTAHVFTAAPWAAWFIVEITTVTGLAIHWGRMRAYEHLIAANQREAAANEQLRSVNQELDRFASVVAHDLKTPLSAIRLKGSALRKMMAGSDAQTVRVLEELDRVADGMSDLIDDLLAYARAGKALHVERVDLHEAFVALHAVFDDRLTSSGGQLELEGPTVLRADRTQVHQLLQNLVGNALQYARPDVPPKITISCRSQDAGVQIAVADNGRGFDPAMTDRLFEPFERGDTDAAGHGLGLATCRRIAEGHGGTIKARTRPGEGSVFTVWLPDAGAPA